MAPVLTRMRAQKDPSNSQCLGGPGAKPPVGPPPGSAVASVRPTPMVPLRKRDAGVGPHGALAPLTSALPHKRRTLCQPHLWKLRPRSFESGACRLLQTACLSLTVCASLALAAPTQMELRPADARGAIVVTGDKSDVRGLRALARDRRFGTAGARMAIRAALDSLGFFSAQWDTSLTDTTRVNLGPRARIDSIAVALPVGIAGDSLQLPRTPLPYNASAIARVASDAVRYCAGRGYPFSEATVDIVRADRADTDAQTRVAVHVSVQLGEKCVVAPPLFTTTLKTNRALLTRDLRMGRGELFDIRKIDQAQARLASRAYIAEVNIGAPVIVAQSADSAARDSLTRVALPCAVKERSGLGVDGVIGLEATGAQSPRLTGLLNVSVLNALGQGEHGALTYRGEKELQVFGLEIGKPWIFRTPLCASGAFDLEIRQSAYGRMEGQLRILSELRTLWQAGVGVRGHTTTTEGSDSASARHWNYYGIDLIVVRQGEPLSAGSRSRHLDMRTGTGIARQDDRNHTRLNVEFSIGTQVPLSRRWAVAANLTTRNLITNEDSLPAIELYRVGGYRSVRGYPDNEFALRTVAYVQGECRLYYSDKGSVYLFTDGGAGFDDPSAFGQARTWADWSAALTKLLGFGLGTRLPTRVGTMSVEWARNYQETRGLGRIHVRFTSPLSIESRL